MPEGMETVTGIKKTDLKYFRMLCRLCAHKVRGVGVIMILLNN